MHIPIICVALHLIHSSSVEELLSDPRAYTRPLNLYTHAQEEKSSKKTATSTKIHIIGIAWQMRKNQQQEEREREIVLT